jgi:predicted dehydrogenase
MPVLGIDRRALQHVHQPDPGVHWLGVCDLMADLAADTRADYMTTDFAELIRRPEVSAVIVATDENTCRDRSRCTRGFPRRLPARQLP